MTTTIAISTDIREELKSFGSKGESYNAILKRVLAIAKERQLQELLLDESDSVSVRDALYRAQKRWRE